MRRDAHVHGAVIAGPSETDGARVAVDFTIDHEHNGITIRPRSATIGDRVCDAIETTALAAMDRCPIARDGMVIIDVSDVDSLPASAPRVFARIAAQAIRSGYRPAFYGARATVTDQIRIFGIDRSYRMFFPGGSPRAA